MGAMQELEARLQSLKGRKFYGTYLNGQYRACVALKDGDDPADLGLKTWVIPGGEFARRKMKNYMEKRGGLVCLNSAARFDKWNRAAVR